VEPGLINANAADRSLAAYDQRYYSYHRFRHGYGADLGFRPDKKNRFSLSFFDSGYKEKKIDNILTTNFDGNATATNNRVFTDTISDGAYQKALVNHTEKLTEQIAIFSGENELGSTLLDYKVAHVMGKYQVLKDVTTTFNSVGSGTVTYDNSGDYPIIINATGPNKNDPANYVFGNYRSSIPVNKTTENTLQANLNIPVSWLASSDEHLKFGGSLRDKKYNADTSNLSGPANSIGQPLLGGYVEGANVVFYKDRYQNGPNLSPALTDALVAKGGFQKSASNVIRDLNAHASAKEKIYAGYFQYDVSISKLTLLAGLRVEDTKGTYEGNLVANNLFQGVVTRSKSYTDYFPAVSLKYDLDPHWVLRASRSSTIARPGFNQISANTQVDTSGYSVTTGNPGLNPTKAASYDLSVERYIGNSGVISLGGFYKKLSDYIVSDVAFLNNTNPLVAGFGFTGNKPITYRSYSNASNSDAKGLELAYEQRFKKLPGYFAGLGFSANYTYVKSKFDIRPGESHTLPSTAKNTYNVSLFYELNPLSIRLSLAHVDKYLSGIGPDATQDLYTDPMNWLDLGVQYQITKTVGLYFAAKNLTDAPVRYTQGTTGRTTQREFYGLTYQAGIDFKF